MNVTHQNLGTINPELQEVHQRPKRDYLPQSVGEPPLPHSVSPDTVGSQESHPRRGTLDKVWNQTGLAQILTVTLGVSDLGQKYHGQS